MSTTSDEAKHWRTIALNCSQIAHTMTDADAKTTMMYIAAGYDRLAELAEEQARLQQKMAVLVPHGRLN